jgi:hypothetical protein
VATCGYTGGSPRLQFARSVDVNFNTLLSYAVLIFINFALWRWYLPKTDVLKINDRKEMRDAFVAAVGVSLFLNMQLLVILAYGLRAYLRGLHVVYVHRGGQIRLSNHEELPFFWGLVFVTCFVWGWVFLLQVTSRITLNMPARTAKRWIFAIGAAGWIAVFVQIIASI